MCSCPIVTHAGAGEARGEQVERRPRRDQHAAADRAQAAQQRDVRAQARVRVGVVLRVDQDAREAGEQPPPAPCAGRRPRTRRRPSGKGKNGASRRRIMLISSTSRPGASPSARLKLVRTVPPSPYACSSRIQTFASAVARAGAAAPRPARARRGARRRRGRRAGAGGATPRPGPPASPAGPRKRLGDADREVVLDGVVRPQLEPARAVRREDDDVLLAGQAVEMGADAPVAEPQVPDAGARERRELEPRAEAPVVQLGGHGDLASSPRWRATRRASASPESSPSTTQRAVLDAHAPRLGVRRQRLQHDGQRAAGRPRGRTRSTPGRPGDDPRPRRT